MSVIVDSSWSLLGEDWRVTFPPPLAIYIVTSILILILSSGFEREVISLPGCGTLSPTMSSTPTSPAFHVFSLPLSSLELGG